MTMEAGGNQGMVYGKETPGESIYCSESCRLKTNALCWFVTVGKPCSGMSPISDDIWQYSVAVSRASVVGKDCIVTTSC